MCHDRKPLLGVIQIHDSETSNKFEFHTSGENEVEFGNTAMKTTSIDMDANERGCRRGLKWDAIFRRRDKE